MFALFMPAGQHLRRPLPGLIWRTPRLRLTAAALLLLAIAPVRADYREDIGYTRLQAELGSSIPDGSGVRVSQIEAPVQVGDDLAWMPNPSHPQFSGKTITDESGATPGVFSSHANGVGGRFYGNTNSIAPGIVNIASYLADHWLGAGLLRTSSGNPGPQAQPDSSSSRIGNHSWIGDGETFNVEILSRLDWLVDRDEFIHFAGYTGSASRPLLSSAYNVITVNRTDAITTTGSANAGGIYTSGRTTPDIVTPAPNASEATPKTASAAALLISAAHDSPALSTDPMQTSVTNRNGDTIFNAERTEVIKAALMAGAVRRTSNTSSIDIIDYRTDPNDRTSNGLDRRFGAGQLNIYNSYQIISAGEQNSNEDAPGNSGMIGAVGFDYDPAFGGSGGSNSQATYFFSTSADTVRLQASLVWNIEIDGGTTFNFDQAATLNDLDLFLFDVTEPSDWVLISSSESISDNTENLWLLLDPEKEYALQVSPGSGQSAFDWDYALAWQIIPITPVSIDPIWLPAAKQGVAYPPQQLLASNGEPPYTWSLVSGFLPLTLSPDGVISGTPTTGGYTAKFTVQVADASGTTDTENLQLKIKALNFDCYNCHAAMPR